MKIEIVLWTADWCGPCQSLKKSRVLEKAMVDLVGALGKPVECSIDVRDVDSKEWEQEAEDQEVKAMPTIDLFRAEKDDDEGHWHFERVHRAVGALTQKQFVTRWKKALAK